MILKQIIIISVAMVSLNIFAQTDHTALKLDALSRNATQPVSMWPLEVGEVKPTGWLRQWAQAAANGITGHLDEYEPVFGKGWTGVDFKARGVREGGTGWPIEQCCYWLDGGVRLAYMLGDSTLIRKFSNRLDIVVNGILSNNSHTFIYWKPDTIVNQYFNNWGHGLMGRALVSYYQATHDQHILKALSQVYHNFRIYNAPYSDFWNLDMMLSHTRGSTNVDAMTETFLINGDKAIIDSIKAFRNRQTVRDIESRMLRLGNNDPLEFRTFHGVTFYELLRVPAIISLWYKNPIGERLTQHLINWGEKSSLMPWGIVSGEEYLSGRGSMHFNETCMIPTSMWSYGWLMRLTGDSRWADRIENVFLNCGPVPIARDWKTMTYYQTPNRYSEHLPMDPFVPGPGDQLYTPHGYDVLCCVGSCNWIIPNYIQQMWLETADHGLACALYGPCKVDKFIRGRRLSINCTTDFPFEDCVSMEVNLDRSVDMPFYFRMPDWADGFEVYVNGQHCKVTIKKGFACIKRRWRNNDNIKVKLPMKAVVERGTETPYPRDNYFMRVPEYKSDSICGQPYEYVKYGPLLFSLSLKEIDCNHVAPGQKFNYALDIKSAKDDIQVTKTLMPRYWRWEYNESPIKLLVSAREINWTPTMLNPLPKKPLPKKSREAGKRVMLQLVPYNCTKFRVTLFPSIE